MLVAEVVSLTGSRMSMVALPWFTLVSTGSATRTGVVAFAETLPYVLVGALGGPLIDRRQREIGDRGQEGNPLFFLIMMRRELGHTNAAR